VLGVHRNTIAQHSKLLGDLIQSNEMQGEYLELRGLVRQRGVLAATPVEVIENIQQYFHDVSSAMPGAHDEATNPADRSEKRQKHALFGAARKHCDRYTSRQRQVQQQQWDLHPAIRTKMRRGTGIPAVSATALVCTAAGTTTSPPVAETQSIAELPTQLRARTSGTWRPCAPSRSAALGG
jgi:hypothetical protein